ncbi:hypothetical protein [Pelagibacterium lentulum]|nr:hypothetical protein [Pelagibacterium lentulum]
MIDQYGFVDAKVSGRLDHHRTGRMPLKSWSDHEDSAFLKEFQAAFDKVKFHPEDSPTGWSDMLKLRRLCEKALTELRAAERAQQATDTPGTRLRAQADMIRDLLTIIDVAMPKDLQQQDIRVWRAREFLASLEPDYRPSPMPSIFQSKDDD